MTRPTVAFDVRPFDQFQIGGQVRYVRDLLRAWRQLAPPVDVALVTSGPGPLWGDLEAVRKATWSVCPLPLATARGMHLLNRIRTGLLAYRKGWDLLHSLHTLAPLPRPKRHVVTVYDLMMERFPEYAAAVRSRAYRQFRRAAERADRVVAISETTASDITTRWSVPSEGICTIPLAQAGDAWSADPATDGPIPVILSPYNLEPRKNLVGLLDAFARLTRDMPEVRLVLFGRAAVTPESERLFETRLAASGCADAVERTGVLSDADLASHYRRAHVMAFPSLYEGFGLPVLEAMHAGRAVVAHDTPAMRELLGSTGALSDAQDPEAFAGTLRDLLQNPARRRALGAAAQQRARRRSTLDVARETWACHAAVLGMAP